MKKGKKILAIIGIVVLAALYIVTLVSAFFVTPATTDFFMISLIATIMIPILLYVYLLIYRLIKGKSEEGITERKMDPEDKKGFEEAFHRQKGDQHEEK